MVMGCNKIKPVISGHFQIALTLVKPLKMCQQLYIISCGVSSDSSLTYCENLMDIASNLNNQILKLI